MHGYDRTIPSKAAGEGNYRQEAENSIPGDPIPDALLQDTGLQVEYVERERDQDGFLGMRPT
ncbi:MAG: hypothetical protein K8S24_09095 [Candidatus Aegiribacteria sp.]|nr:hypothetical protein [Candidatus Aegiribacteria sp.]